MVVIKQETTAFVDVRELSLACAKANQALNESSPTDTADIADLLNRATDRLRKALSRHDIDSDRSPAAWSALTIAVEEGFSDSEIEALILAHPTGVGERYLSDQEALPEDIRRARTKSNGSSKDNSLPSGFRRATDGSLLYRRSGKEEEASYARLCSPLSMSAVAEWATLARATMLHRAKNYWSFGRIRRQGSVRST